VPSIETSNGVEPVGGSDAVDWATRRQSARWRNQELTKRRRNRASPGRPARPWRRSEASTRLEATASAGDRALRSPRLAARPRKAMTRGANGAKRAQKREVIRPPYDRLHCRQPLSRRPLDLGPGGSFHRIRLARGCNRLLGARTRREARRSNRRSGRRRVDSRSGEQFIANEVDHEVPVFFRSSPFPSHRPAQVGLG
jgi:hypothetical protein